MMSLQEWEAIVELAARRWSINACALIITALLGEWLCVQRELQDIPLGSGGSCSVPSVIAHVNLWMLPSCSTVTSIASRCQSPYTSLIPAVAALGVRRPKTPVVSVEAVPLKSATDSHV